MTGTMQARAVLPPGMTAGAFARLLDQLGAVVGRGHVLTDDACFAVVEPGVRFSDLSEHLRSINSKCWVGRRHLRTTQRR